MLFEPGCTYAANKWSVCSRWMGFAYGKITAMIKVYES